MSGYLKEWFDVMIKIAEAFAPKEVSKIPFYEVSVIFERDPGYFYMYNEKEGMLRREITAKKAGLKYIGRMQIVDLDNYCKELTEIVSKPTCKGARMFVEFRSFENYENRELIWRLDSEVLSNS